MKNKMDLTRALRLNNEGIMLLLGNRDQEAESKLTSALSQVTGLFLAASEDTGAECESATPSKPFIHHSTYTLPNLQDVSCFVYSNALVFSFDSESTALSSDDVRTYTSVIILNIALAYHRRGISENPECLRKAEKMYEIVGHLLRSSDTNQGTALLVKIAAINNLSQLRYGQGDFVFSREGFQYLGSLLSYAGANLHQTKCQDHVYTGMLLNALLATPPDKAPAA
jgi:hypothetical protein